jgi:hypothetical protein
MRLMVVVLAPIAACSYASYAPPARTMPLETAVAPAVGHGDVQIEGNLVAAIFGFDTTNGGVRLRQGIDEHVAISGDLGVLTVNGETAGGEDHRAYLSRVGVHVHQADRAPGPHIALTGGIGGGTSALAGRWAAFDLGVIASSNGTYVVPFIAVDGFASVPVDAKDFTWTDSSGDPKTDRLTPTAGYRFTAGLEVRPYGGPDSEVSLLGGVMIGGIADADDDEVFLGLGAAVRATL